MADTLNPSHSSLALPALDSLNPSDVEVFYDADLDEMTIHFYGSNVPYVVDSINDVYSILVDMDADRIVGVLFSRFLKQVIQDIPDSRALFDEAVILVGENVVPPSSPFPSHPTLRQRIVAAFHGMRTSWESGDDEAAQRKRAFDAIPRLCS